MPGNAGRLPVLSWSSAEQGADGGLALGFRIQVAHVGHPFGFDFGLGVNRCWLRPAAARARAASRAAEAGRGPAGTRRTLKHPACRAPPRATGSRRKTIEEVAETDLWPEFGCQPHQSVSSIARADPAGDPDDHEGIEGEALAVVHRQMFLFCSLPVKPPDAVAKMDRASALQARDESTERSAIALGQRYQGWRGGAPRA